MKKTGKQPEEVEPLRLLRTKAGLVGAPLTQVQLSADIDVSLDTVRAIENRRRSLTEPLFRKIRQSIGAEWRPEKQNWSLIDRPDIPYSADIYAKFRTKWFAHPHQTEIEAHILCRRLIELLSRVEDEQYNALFYRIFDFLDDTRTDLHINGVARRVFKKTQFKIDLLREGKGGEIGLIVRQFRQMDNEIVFLSKGRGQSAQFLNFSWLMRPEQSDEDPWRTAPEIVKTLKNAIKRAVGEEETDA